MTNPLIRVKSAFLIDIKTSIVKALRAAFDDIAYPDDEIQGINISMEYPMEENQYPSLWVQFSMTKLQNAGIGHTFIKDGTVRHEFYFEGTVRLNVIGLSSKERDRYASQLIQMLAFRDLNPVAAQFDEYLKSATVYLTINRDVIQLQGQQTTMGTPWNDNIPTYEDGFAFDLIGQVESTFYVTPEVLKKIHVTATQVAGAEPLSTTQFDIIANTVSPGTWQ